MTSVSRIDTVRLGGQDGPEVGVQGFGAMGISEFYGDTDEAAARDTLDAALEAGVTLIDTAYIYGSGANEEFLAPFLAAHRDEVTLATKFAIERRADDPTYRAVRNDPAYIRKAAEDSLRRLGVETIDLYYMHRRDPEVPFAESVGAMAETRPGGQGPLPGPERGHRARAARGPRGAPDHRPPARSGRSSPGTWSAAPSAPPPSSE
ncbi:hypothetical protein STANM309S_05306 [Streptomyces tanashiensis]